MYVLKTLSIKAPDEEAIEEDDAVVAWTPRPPKALINTDTGSVSVFEEGCASFCRVSRNPHDDPSTRQVTITISGHPHTYDDVSREDVQEFVSYVTDRELINDEVVPD